MNYKRVLFYQKDGYLSAPSNYFSSVSDTITPTETLLKQTGKVITDTNTSYTESVVTTKVNLVNVSDAITLVETFTKSITKVISESVSLVENLAITFLLTISNSINLSESVTTVKERLIIISEQISLVETVIKYLNGNIVGLWSKIAKPVGTIWTKIAKPGE